jgi:nucleotide-binding universal stress UspA family protein
MVRPSCEGDAEVKRKEKDMPAIVVGVDGSHDSDAALFVANRLAREIDARLLLVHVVEPVPTAYAGPAMGMGAGTSGLLDANTPEQTAAAADLLENVASAAAITDAEHRVVFGFPAERLAEVADDEDAEYIVVGSRGRGAFKAAFLGSVSTSLIGIARCPVLVVPPGAAEVITAGGRIQSATRT